jgi:hypothetical protein
MGSSKGDVYKITGTTMDAASGKVDSKFSTAVENAKTAYSRAESAIGTIAVKGRAPNTSLTDVRFYYDHGEVINRIKNMLPPNVTLDNIDVTRPTLGTLRTLPAFDSVVTSLRTALAARYAELVVEGTTGLDADIEALIWARALSRTEIDNLRLYTEAEQYFSSRGYTLPPGVLAARLNEIGIEIARNNTYINNDITVEQARLAQNNMHWVLENGVTFVTDDMKITISSILEHNKSVIDKYVAELEGYKQDLAVALGRLDLIVKMYMSNSENFRALASVASADIEAQTASERLSLEEARAELELEIKNTEINLTYLNQVYGMQLEAVRTIGSIASQVAAGSLSGVNATASIGFSGSESISNTMSDSYDVTKGNESGATTSNIHTYDETKSTD